MKRILYITNIEVPYRVRFFNELAKKYDLTVLYERKKSANRNTEWAKSENKQYKTIYLNGLKIGNESGFDIRIIKYILSGYDAIIIGCCNSKAQIFAMTFMRILRKPYILNIDGELFIGAGFKSKLKSLVIKGAYGYMVAGNKAAESIRNTTRSKKVFSYGFSSLSIDEIHEHASGENKNRNDNILVIGQYMDYKGMDVALEVAKKNDSLKYKFIGTGYRSNLLLEDMRLNNVNNVEVIPFLQKDKLEKEYINCSMLILPSRQECWGLVINEAASFGTPIVSTWGSGAAVEFLADEYSCFLAQPGNADDLYNKIIDLINYRDIKKYKKYLIDKSTKYTIEGSAKDHIAALEQII